MGRLITRTGSAKPDGEEVRAFYEGRIAECVAASSAAKLAATKEKHETAGKRWRELLAIHVQCEAEDDGFAEGNPS